MTAPLFVSIPEDQEEEEPEALEMGYLDFSTCDGCDQELPEAALCQTHYKCGNCHPLYTSREAGTWADCAPWQYAHHTMKGCCDEEPYENAPKALRPRIRELLQDWGLGPKRSAKLDEIDKEEEDDE